MFSTVTLTIRSKSPLPDWSFETISSGVSKTEYSISTSYCVAEPLRTRFQM